MTAVLRAPSTAVTVFLSGDLDIATAPDVRRQLMDAVAPGAHLTVDMAGVTFLGASGIGVLVAAANAARAAGGDLSLRAPAVGVMRVLAVLGLGGVLPVVGLAPLPPPHGHHHRHDPREEQHAEDSRSHRSGPGLRLRFHYSAVGTGQFIQRAHGVGDPGYPP